MLNVRLLIGEEQSMVSTGDGGHNSHYHLASNEQEEAKTSLPCALCGKRDKRAI